MHSLYYVLGVIHVLLLINLNNDIYIFEKLVDSQDSTRSCAAMYRLVRILFSLLQYPKAIGAGSMGGIITFWDLSIHRLIRSFDDDGRDLWIRRILSKRDILSSRQFWKSQPLYYYPSKIGHVTDLQGRLSYSRKYNNIRLYLTTFNPIVFIQTSKFIIFRKIPRNIDPTPKCLLYSQCIFIITYDIFISWFSIVPIISSYCNKPVGRALDCPSST